jgi:ketosteroid isomerase-like protein
VTPRVHLIALLLTAAAPVATPAQGAATRDVATLRKELLAIEAEIARANRECDYKYFARIEAAEFFFTDSRGGLTTRAQDLAGESGCRPNTSTQVLDEVVVQSHGETAVLGARSTTTSTGPDGQPRTSRSRFTDVFVWRGGRWQLVAGHSSRIP